MYSLSVQPGLILYFLDPPSKLFFLTSVHFIKHPLPLPRLFQPSCLYQHDTSLGLVSFPSCSESGHHSLNPQYKQLSFTQTQYVCVCPNRKNGHSQQTVTQNILPWSVCSIVWIKNSTLKHYLPQHNCMWFSRRLNAIELITKVNLVYSLWQIHYSKLDRLFKLDIWIPVPNFRWYIFVIQV